MKVEFRGSAGSERHRDVVLVDGAVEGRPVRFRFTRDAVRSVGPSVADGRDLLARFKSQEDVFAAVVARKLAATDGESPAELTVTEADMLPEATAAGGGRWPDDGGSAESAVNEYA